MQWCHQALDCVTQCYRAAHVYQMPWPHLAVLLECYGYVTAAALRPASPVLRLSALGLTAHTRPPRPASRQELSSAPQGELLPQRRTPRNRPATEERHLSSPSATDQPENREMTSRDRDREWRRGSAESRNSRGGREGLRYCAAAVTNPQTQTPRRAGVGTGKLSATHRQTDSEQRQ